MDWLHVLLMGSTGVMAAVAVVATGKAHVLEKLLRASTARGDAACRELLLLSQEMTRQVHILESLAERAAGAAGSYRGS